MEFILVSIVFINFQRKQFLYRGCIQAGHDIYHVNRIVRNKLGERMQMKSDYCTICNLEITLNCEINLKIEIFKKF